jgi:hypothetical protein
LNETISRGKSFIGGAPMVCCGRLPTRITRIIIPLSLEGLFDTKAKGYDFVYDAMENVVIITKLS